MVWPHKDKSQNPIASQNTARASCADVGNAGENAGICGPFTFAASAFASLPIKDSCRACGNQAGNSMMTDPIADMLTRIRNASRAGKKTVDIPRSQLKLGILSLLREEGYLEDIQTIEEPSRTPMIRVTLKYRGKEPVIHELKRESKPGLRVYRGAEEIPTIVNGYGIAILSTSRGLMTNRAAKKLKIGGEIMCSVY